MSAQKARGADFSTGKLTERAKALLPLLVPLFVSSFRRADELAVAMESRCYHGGEGRTRMNDAADGAARLALAFLASGAHGARRHDCHERVRHMRNIALRLRYDGSAYHGWQVQRYDVSVAATRGKGALEGLRPPGQGHRLRAHGRRGPRAQLLRQLPHGEPHPG